MKETSQNIPRNRTHEASTTAQKLLGLDNIYYLQCSKIFKSPKSTSSPIYH